MKRSEQIANKKLEQDDQCDFTPYFKNPLGNRK
jgi:hypothetical protein